ncbi:sporulation protein YqfC [Amphibacillus sp. Q70]|uniref:sporulation protein YqfC n=1 Tax=Amphibacillus sp. Q70 TaxID=3453416 RepID=UPI003F8492B3
MRKLQAFFDNLKKTKSNMMITTHLNLPRITMIGDIHIYIENHRGILRFTSQEIILKITNGQLIIKGSELVIKMLLSSEILIEGKIDSLKMDESSTKNGVEK